MALRTATVTVSTIGVDAGPFTVTDGLGQTYTGISRATLLAGYSNTFDDAAVQFTVTSDPPCSTVLNIPVVAPTATASPTPTSTPTPTPTPTASPTATPTPSPTPLALNISSASGPNACAAGGEVNGVSNVTYVGTPTLCGASQISINDGAAFALPTGTYFVSDGQNYRSFSKSASSIVFTPTNACTLC